MKQRLLRQTWLGWAIAAWVSIHHLRAARGEDVSEAISRQQLIDAADTAHNAGHHDVAVEYLRRSAAIRSSATLMLRMAQEQVELGAPVEAYGSARLCLRQVELDPKGRLRNQAEVRCKALLAELASRVAQVVIDLPAVLPGLALRVGGNPVHIEAAGTQYLVHPGKVTIEATAPDHEPMKTEITIAAGEIKSVPIALQSSPCAGGVPRSADGSCPQSPTAATTLSPAPLSLAPPASSSSADPNPASASTTPADAPLPQSAAGGMGRRWGLVLAGAGAVLLVGGAIAWEVADSKYSSTRDACNLGCTTTRRSDGVSSVQNWDRAAAIGFVSGGVAVAAGAALYLLLPSAESPNGTQVSLSLDPGRRGFSVGGTF
jgi:hypothetical protein